MRQRVLPGSGIRRGLSGCRSLRFLRGSLGIVRMRVVILRVSHASIVPAETCFAQPATRYAHPFHEQIVFRRADNNPLSARRNPICLRYQGLGKEILDGVLRRTI